MKKLNIILISEEGQPAAESLNLLEAFPQDTGAEINVLNSLLADNPTLAESAEFKGLLELSDKVKAELGEGAPADTEVKEQQEPDNKGADSKQPKPADKKVKTPLSSLPFFSEGDGDENELASVSLENLPDYAKKIGVDTTKEGWFAELVSKAAPPVDNTTKVKYDELVESINLLPKELASAVNLAIEGKDWRSLLSNSSAIDLSKDFSELSADEKIKVHNFYFPDDIILPGEDISKKEVVKSIKAAEAKFGTDKYIQKEKTEKETKRIQDSKAQYISSVDASIGELKKEYPNFSKKELKEVEEVIKNQGVYNMFFDKQGNLKPDGAKKIVFALKGEDVLRVATSLAENRGKSKGKAEVLDVSSGVDKTPKGGGTELTDLEKGVNKFVNDSFVSNKLTY